MKSMSGIIYKGLILLLGLALGASVTKWSKTKQEIQAMAASNETLRKTLGEMAIALTDRDRSIDRLTSSRCDEKEKSHVDAGSAPLRASRP
jgi:hypothetical protein